MPLIISHIHYGVWESGGVKSKVGGRGELTEKIRPTEVKYV